MQEARPEPALEDNSLVELVPMVRRIVGSRIRDPHVVDDLVQETLARVMAARSRVEGDTLEPYAAVTARNVVASHARRNDRARDRVHLLADSNVDEPPTTAILRKEEGSMLAAALARLPSSERDLLIAHEVQGADTRTLAAHRGSTSGAIAAQLSRARSKLRVEYLLVEEDIEPSRERCRPVLRALSAGDRRRQRELDAGRHLLECQACARISSKLLDRRGSSESSDQIRVPVASDPDVVRARQVGREVATEAGFEGTELTLLATAISEIARNIVRFAERGEILISAVSGPDRQGVTIVARDVGPGIDDVALAMRDGYSTYKGLGLGLPGAKRLMDEFEIASEIGRGTTVTMTKWRSLPK